MLTEQQKIFAKGLMAFLLNSEFLDKNYSFSDIHSRRRVDIDITHDDSVGKYKYIKTFDYSDNPGSYIRLKVIFGRSDNEEYTKKVLSEFMYEKEV
jgi:hypothetical protein